MNRFRMKTQTLLFSTLFGVLAVLLLVIYWLLNAEWERIAPEYKIKFLQDQSQKMAYMMRTQITQGPFTSEEAIWLDNVSKLYSASLRFTADNRTEVWYDSENRGVSSAEYSPARFEIPYIVDGKLIGYLHVSYELDGNHFFPDLTVMENKLKKRWTAGLCVLLALLFVVSYGLSRRLARPLRDCSEMAEKMASEQWETTLPEKGTAEMARISHAFNTLLAEFNLQEQWRRQMLQDVSHELRTPLTTVLSRLEAMIDGIYPLTEPHLQRIFADIDRLSRLVADVGKLSEADGARFKMNVERVDLIEVIKSIQESIAVLVKEKEITCKLNYPFVPCFANVDQDRIIQVLFNVISNAIKYTAPGGEIELGLYSKENESIIYCTDSGIGIAKEDIPFVFNRFYRTDKSRSRDNGGLGVGLSIAKALVEAHDGVITVESESGKGSTFTIRLPVKTELLEEGERQSG